MPNIDKDIVITPNKGQASEPSIVFTGFNNSPITLRVLDDGSLSFEGTAGQLFNISDGLTGVLFSVNDVSGLPLIDVIDNGDVEIAHFTGRLIVGATIPAANNTYDLGSAAARWRNIFTQDLHLSNGIGDYTIVEGEEHLYLTNNKNGKNYKFVLEEVDSSEVPAKSSIE